MDFVESLIWICISLRRYFPSGTWRALLHPARSSATMITDAMWTKIFFTWWLQSYSKTERVATLFLPWCFSRYDLLSLWLFRFAVTYRGRRANRALMRGRSPWRIANDDTPSTVCRIPCTWSPYLPSLINAISNRLRLQRAESSIVNWFTSRAMYFTVLTWR